MGTKGLFNPAENITRTNGWKPKPFKFKLVIRHTFLTVRVISIWSKLSGEIVDSLSLAVFQTRMNAFLEDTLYNLTDYWVYYRGNWVKCNFL